MQLSGVRGEVVCKDFTVAEGEVQAHLMVTLVLQELSEWRG